jgi:solute carrier family 39 (zinc transporter), member 7
MSMEAKAFTATMIISLLPNLLLFFIPMTIFQPAGINEHSYNYQNLFLAFASGGLLGDVFLHVLPHLTAHTATHYHDHHHDHDHHEGENPLIGIIGFAIVIGYLIFLLIERLSSAPSSHADKIKDDEDSNHQAHTHAHGHAHCPSDYSSIFGKISTAGWLNITADSMHNFTDGIAIGAAFAVRKSNVLALSTFLSVLFHEIPHEIGDFSVLVNSGLTK